MTTIPPVGLAELTEIDAYTDFATAAPQALRDELGIGSMRIGSALALAIRADESRFFNRAGGFGVDEPVTVDVLAQACDFFREQGIDQGSIMIAPDLLPADWAAQAAKLNLVEGSRYAKTACAVAKAAAATPTLDPALRVGRVEPQHAHEFATVLMTTFGFGTPAMIDMATAFVGRDGWQQYAVWENERIVAVGSLHVTDDCADMFGGATTPAARGRGAQSALLATRAKAALDAGCRWLVADTGAEADGEHNTSLHNMLRTGFEVVYERTSWVWHA